MTFSYDGRHFYPPTPVLPVTVGIPGDGSKHITIDDLTIKLCGPREELDIEPGGP